jgi:hypothetical protein
VQEPGFLGRDFPCVHFAREVKRLVEAWGIFVDAFNSLSSP